MAHLKIAIGLALGESWHLLAVDKGLFPPKGVPENTDVNSWITHYSRVSYNISFASALGGACAKGTNTMALIQTSSIQAIMTLPQRLSFSAQLTNCNFATCWQVEPSILSLLQLSFNIHSSNGFSCPVKFFHLSRAKKVFHLARS